MPLFLDTGVLGLVTHPRANDEARECHSWLIGCVDAGSTVCLPEICDYELRRDYVRRTNTNALRRLDELGSEVAQYIPITTSAMRDAAELWAKMRRQGKPTAPHHALDADVILAAQAGRFATPGGEMVIVVTTDVGDLTRLALVAKRWRDIPVGKY
ncbi:MAG TPA: hypothetical protein VME42_17260 [Steroidobacteraceae bacterium]|nr:hypothetical protein [Steroidobacteraceae bacterium]